MLVGVKTWAVAHLISNGDLGSIVLFGSFLAWAVYRPDHAQAPHRSRRAADSRSAGRRNDIDRGRWSARCSISRSALVFHPLVVGIPVFGRPAY